ncbi:sterol regulatory element-binding protein 1 [Diplogelasinospora grovesii]|uniref:Sterol regulatory element-binding protein 1 n=1 Tax=Diplogelasinospora grovesii TaxID=303347 RepID=A0AAN6S913_9PEZI|nr:sterol regulatory element-binding protein 1 [Diplogelasinospora grovesii]
MADPDASSAPPVFAGMENWDLGDGVLGDGGGLNVGAAGGVFMDGNGSSSSPATSSHRAGSIASSPHETTTTAGTGTASAGANNNVPISPPVINGGQQQSFYNFSSPNWSFQQDTPPYESPNSANPFDTVPTIPSQAWEAPAYRAQNPSAFQQQYPPPLPQFSQQPPPHRGFDFNNANSYTAVPGVIPGPPIQSQQSPTDEKLVRPKITTKIQTTLTPAQQEKLRSIAMPQHLQYQSPRSASAGSPDSNGSGNAKGAGSSPDGAELSKTSSRKRKSSADMEDDDDDEEELDGGGQPVKKTAHNMIEKRYRTNLNDKIAALRDSVPALRIMSKSARGEDTTEDREELHGLTPAHKLNKATVLSKATEYIRHLEKRNNRLLEEKSSMQARITAFEKLFMAGAMSGQLPNPMQAPPTPMQYPPGSAAFMNTPMPTPGPSDPPGLIPVPDDMKRILTDQQMHSGGAYPVPPQGYMGNPAMQRQQVIQQQQQQAGGGWSPYYGRLMVGSLAGLMLIDALVMENEQSNETPDGRGLGALPVQLLSNFVHSTHLSIGGYFISAVDLIAKLKLFGLIALFVWVAFGPYLPGSSTSQPAKQKRAASVVEAVPSLASPIHVRRRAWDTAIQTVWVPRHNFLLEAAALMLKTIKYAFRNLLGERWFLSLVGLSEEQEAARVKAWTIALDAQLAGGDVEINKSRLTLTLLASGTLPDTPLRLMLKSLHIRVLLWQLNNVASLTKLFATKLARAKWKEAQELYRILHSLHEGKLPDDENLPEHLALLLEQDCDDVLNDDIVQRAHNLAWNKPTAHNMVDKVVDGMNTVVDDPAVSSPMDAIAAWYSNLVLQRVLTETLSRTNETVVPEELADWVADKITLAIDIAPPGSNARVRALVARTVLISEKRGINLATAIQAMGPSLNPDKHPQYSKGVPPLIDSPMTKPIVPDPDVQLALRCAQAIAHLDRYAAPPPEMLAVIKNIPLNLNVHSMSLLGFTATFNLVERLNRHAVGRETCSASLERSAGTLRIWLGSKAAVGHEGVGLSNSIRRKLVDRCLAVRQSVVGLEIDPGYETMSDGAESQPEGC